MSPGAIRVEQVAPVAVVALAGEHDSYSAARLEAALIPLAAAGPLVVDLSAATFIDSATVSVLLKALRVTDEHGLVLVLDDESGAHVRRLLELTRLDSVLDLRDSRDAALDALQHAA